MKFHIITIFPEMFKDVFNEGILKKGIDKQLIDIKIHNLRDYTNNKHKQVDDRPFGGEVGMILKVEPLFNAINSIKNKSPEVKVVFLTPKGEKYTQEKAELLSQEESLILICGRYEGVDQRVIDELVDIEISIGNFVLSGGEIPAMVIVDSISRLVKGVIQNEDFNQSESFSNPDNRNLLDYPQYTRPENYNGLKVPKVLLSGNHKEIEKWREQNRKR